MKKHLKHFIRLVNFEFERMFKFLASIMAIVVISNLVGFVVVPLSYMSSANEMMQRESWTVQQFIDNNELFSIYNVFRSFWMTGPIALGAIGLLLFSIFIWYREWFGKNTFVYRLLMLPVPRMQIYFSKLLVILVGIFSLLSIQLIMLWIGNQIIPNFVSNDLYQELGVAELLSSSALSFLIHNNIYEFLSIYGVGIVALLVLFTAILPERSFRVKGLIFGFIYCVITLATIISPLLIPIIAQNRYILFTSEQVALHAVMIVIVGVTSIFISRYLLKHKITV